MSVIFLVVMILCQGNIHGIITHAQLTPLDCFFLAKETFAGESHLDISGGIDYTTAIEWAEAALK